MTGTPSCALIHESIINETIACEDILSQILNALRVYVHFFAHAIFLTSIQFQFIDSTF